MSVKCVVVASFDAGGLYMSLRGSIKMSWTRQRFHNSDFQNTLFAFLAWAVSIRVVHQFLPNSQLFNNSLSELDVTCQNQLWLGTVIIMPLWNPVRLP